MTTNRLSQPISDEDRLHPPKGKDPDQVLARQRFWIERGNQLLWDQGRTDLRWVCRNGHYQIVHWSEA